jgi:hypothetical protein
VGADRNNVRHCARWNKETGLFSKHAGHLLLKRDNSWIIAQNVVSNLGFGHGLPHAF